MDKKEAPKELRGDSLESLARIQRLWTAPSGLSMQYAAARLSPAGLATLATADRERPWRLYPHLRELSQALVRGALTGNPSRLLVLMPPQHGKSELCSHYFAAWYLGTFPDRRVIVGSYESDFAKSWGRKARNTFAEWGPPLWGVSVDPQQRGADDWSVRGRSGGMVTAGRGAGITGRGADLLLIDDSIKDGREAASHALRRDLWDWYRSTAYTRVHTGGLVVLVHTRWHEDDLPGQVLRQATEGGDQWQVLKFPAISESGAPLCPQLFPLAELERKRVTLGSYYWTAEYQQEPSPAGGEIFHRTWFRYYYRDRESFVLVDPSGTERRVRREDCTIFQTCDPAATQTERSDWFALLTWAVTPTSDLLLLDVLRERAETVAHLDMLRQAFSRWIPVVQGVERVSFGLALIQQALAVGMPIVSLPAERDKVSRARAMSARYEAGAVWHPPEGEAPWLAEYESELLRFPTGAHDDQVDCAAYAAMLLAAWAVQPQEHIVVYHDPVRISPV